MKPIIVHCADSRLVRVLPHQSFAALLLLVVLCALPVQAQRDYQLTEQRNPWLSVGSAAALTTFDEQSIAHVTLSYGHVGGALHSLSEGRRINDFSADVRSYYRLTKDVVAYGSMTYNNFNGSQMAGSMLMPTTELKPFDLIGDSADIAGDKHAESFNIVGAIGWQCLPALSFGAKVDYTAANYAKHRDLRHSNTLMDLKARFNTLWTFNGNDGVGAGFVYRRRTETISFDTYGTTDRVYATLVDYANGYGETEIYGVDGFTDDTNELPLVSYYYGATMQGKLGALFADATYLHRTGYYGRKSQYTAAHERHHGDGLQLHLRYGLLHASTHLLWIDATLLTEKLTAERENYRRMTTQNSNAANYYEYYEPTKMSDKAQTTAEASATAYWKPVGEIFLWYLRGGANYWVRHQTAYLYPEMYTTKPHVFAPFAEARRRFLTHSSSLFSLEAGSSVLTGSLRQIIANAAAGYEFPVRGTKVRPEVSLRYDFRKATGGEMKGLTRNTLTVNISATF